MSDKVIKQLIVDETNKGKRFDIVASQMLPMLSRAFVKALIEGQRIKLNGDHQKHGYKLRIGDEITTDFEESEINEIPDIELPVIYEDDDVLVINKPTEIISHSRGRYWNEPSVASFVRQKTAQDGDRAGIVHRLDKATSGVMICAKNQAALSHLQKQFSLRKVKKQYIAIVHGHMDPPEAIIDMPIERNPQKPITFRASSGGKTASTHYTVKNSHTSYDEVLLEPETGRTHQLRVHLNHVGHPIVGDHLYGTNANNAERLYLHAYKLEITLPGGKRQIFTAPKPTAFKEFFAV